MCTPSQPARGGEIGTIVQDEGDPTGLDHWPQNVARPPDLVIARVLKAKLHAGDVAGVERFRQQSRKRRRVETRRRDQIKSAVRLPGSLRGLGHRLVTYLAEEDVDDLVQHLQGLLARPLESVTADDLAVAAAVVDILCVLIDGVGTLHRAA